MGHADGCNCKACREQDAMASMLDYLKLVNAQQVKRYAKRYGVRGLNLKMVLSPEGEAASAALKGYHGGAGGGVIDWTKAKA